MSPFKRPQIALDPDEIPTKWFNIAHYIDIPPPKEPDQAQLPEPDPLEGEKRIDMLPKILIGACLEMEASTQEWIPIPGEVIDLFLRVARPRPLMRAIGLENALKLPANVKLFYKTEFFSPPGSHKLNTALAQVFFAKNEGYSGVSTETGAGQWGSALSFACSLLEMECKVFWVRSAYERFPERLKLMNLYGAKVKASPSHTTKIGRAMLEKDPHHPGSLGLAISEGLEVAKEQGDEIRYLLGSVLNHVLIQQTIIGLEVQKQLELGGEQPTHMISCLGGGSNFGGFTLPFVPTVLKKKREIEFIAVNTKEVPNLTGTYRYDFADHASLTPMLKMLTLGHEFSMPSLPAEGLLYHAAAPAISVLVQQGVVTPTALEWSMVQEGARLFIRKEGFIPAPESAYAVAQAIETAQAAKTARTEATIVFNVSGHGLLGLDSF
ncbi:MAG: TrpB-like pyridoxal phosphate-dependent enzyme [Candidatus Heimdallarchaeota archaeon]